MTEQPGPRDPAERRATDRPGKGVDVFGDLQRWFIRQSAKNMRREISGQVRRTFNGGRETSDVWDTATNEIPPEVGESPECQWCPICRAARRMRDSGPGIGGQLSGAGDVVASAVQDAISALDSLLAKAGGTAPTRDSTDRDSKGTDSTDRDSTGTDSTDSDAAAKDGPAADNGRKDGEPQQSASSGTSGTSGASLGTEAAESSAASWPASPPPHGSTESDNQQGTSNQAGRDRTAPDSRRDRHGLVGLPGGGDSAAAGSAVGSAAHAGGSGPASEPADWLATARDREPDPWGAATDSAAADRDSDADVQSDGSGHEPDDRG